MIATHTATIEADDSPVLVDVLDIHQAMGEWFVAVQYVEEDNRVEGCPLDDLINLEPVKR